MFGMTRTGKSNTVKKVIEATTEVSEKAANTCIHVTTSSTIDNVKQFKLVVPTKGIALDGEVDFLSSVRRTIYEFFMSQPERNGFMDALKWLIFEEYNAPNVKDTWHLATCPNCNEGVDIQRHKIQSDYTIKCPHCGEKIYLTDVLRLHEAIDNELGAGGILGYLTTTVEQIIIPITDFRLEKSLTLSTVYRLNTTVTNVIDVLNKNGFSGVSPAKGFKGP